MICRLECRNDNGLSSILLEHLEWYPYPLAEEFRPSVSILIQNVDEEDSGLVCSAG